MILKKITPRLLVAFLLLSPLPLAGFAWIYTIAIERSIQESVLEHLDAIADKNADAILTYLEERLTEASLLAKSNYAQQALDTLPALLKQEGIPSSRYMSMQQKIYDYFFSALDDAGYYDVLIIDTAGDVIFSVLRESDLGTNLNTGPYRDSTLAQAQREATALITPQVTQAHAYAPSNNRPAIFVVNPIFRSGKLIGTMALQLDLDKFTRVTGDAIGLGKTGETVLAQRSGDEVLYVAPLRHIPDAAFQHHAKFDTASHAMQAALSGWHAHGMIDDYANTAVVAVWRYLPAMRWGMVVKMDRNEAFASLNKLRQFSLIALGLLLLVAMLVALLFGRMLVAPVHRLMAVTEQIARGDLTQRAPTHGWQELQQLASSFNHMANNLNTSHQELESKVILRTQELKHERDFATTLVNTAPVIVLLLDLRGTIQLVNPYFEYISGYASDKIIGKEWFSTFIPIEKQEYVRKLFHSATHEKATRGNIYTIITREGEERSIEWFDQTIRDTNDTVTGLLAIGQDVTERLRSETILSRHQEHLEELVEERTAEMKIARDEAERASAAKSEFLSRMSHELRTPLNAILGFGQLLETDPEQPLSELQADNVHEILNAGNHLLELVNEVLDLSRIESGRLEVKLENIAIIPLIKTCLTQLQPLAMQRQIECNLELFTSYTVLADTMRLQQVLINLLSNAIKYNRDGGHIRINGSPTSANALRINIQDSGRGINVDMLPRLFKPFERLESAYEGIEGTGIGLALTKKLVDAMHGNIGVESIEGEGSTFWFELPLSSALTEDKTHEPHKLDPDPATCDSYRVLYIEDNPANLKLMQKIMATRKNIDLLSAVNAEAGLDIAFNQPLDLILLDINLPGMDGFEALRQLRDNPATQNTPVIAVTANAMKYDIERGKTAGFNDYLTKPIDVTQFFELLDRNLPEIKQ